MEPVFVLVHSPSVGPATWQPVAAELSAAGHRVVVPSLRHVGVGGPPFWPRAVEAVRDALDGLPGDEAGDGPGQGSGDGSGHGSGGESRGGAGDGPGGESRGGAGAGPGDESRGGAAAERPVVLVAHSNAGLLIPVIRAGLDRPVAAAVLVDAALPARTRSSPAAPAELLEYLGTLAVDGVLPRWTDWWDEADVAALFAGLADPALREAVIADQPALPLAYFAQDIPVPPGWDDELLCSYLLFSPAYDDTFADARNRGWQVDHLAGAHLHQIVDPAGTAARLLALARRPPS